MISVWYFISSLSCILYNEQNTDAWLNWPPKHHHVRALACKFLLWFRDLQKINKISDILLTVSFWDYWVGKRRKSSTVQIIHGSTISCIVQHIFHGLCILVAESMEATSSYSEQGSPLQWLHNSVIFQYIKPLSLSIYLTSKPVGFTLV